MKNEDIVSVLASKNLKEIHYLGGEKMKLKTFLLLLFFVMPSLAMADGYDDYQPGENLCCRVKQSSYVWMSKQPKKKNTGAGGWGLPEPARFEKGESACHQTRNQSFGLDGPVIRSSFYYQKSPDGQPFGDLSVTIYDKINGQRINNIETKLGFHKYDQLQDHFLYTGSTTKGGLFIINCWAE